MRAVFVKHNRVISNFPEVICGLSAPVLGISNGSLSVWTFYAFAVNINMKTVVWTLGQADPGLEMGMLATSCGSVGHHGPGVCRNTG